MNRNEPAPTEEHAYPLPHHVPRHAGNLTLRFAMVHDVIHERFPRHGSAFYAERNRQVRRMIGRLQKKVEQNPQDAAAHYALASAYFNAGQVPEGENELKRVLELQPQNTRARTELGASYLRQERGKEAQEEFARLAAQEPNNVDAHAGLGMALAEQGNHEAAIAEYETTLHLEPQANGVHYRMGISQAQLKRYDDAIASYLKERQQTGDDADLESALADAYLAKGMTHEMQDARDRALQLRSGQRE